MPLFFFFFFLLIFSSVKHSSVRVIMSWSRLKTFDNEAGVIAVVATVYIYIYTAGSSVSSDREYKTVTVAAVGSQIIIKVYALGTVLYTVRYTWRII